MLIKQVDPANYEDLSFLFAISTDNDGTLNNGLTWVMHYSDSTVIYKD